MTTILSWLGFIVAFWLVTSILLFGTTFALYASVFKFKELRDSGELAKRHWSVRMYVYTILYAGLGLDALLNLWTLSVLYLEWPKETLCTSRVQRWVLLSGYRQRMSAWLAVEYLLPIDKLHIKMKEGENQNVV